LRLECRTSLFAGVALGNTVNGKGGGAIEQLSDQRTDLFFVAPRRRSGALGTQKIWVKTRLYARARFAGFRKEPLKHALSHLVFGEALAVAWRMVDWNG
jgi:hypothetical protein